MTKNTEVKQHKKGDCIGTGACGICQAEIYGAGGGMGKNNTEQNLKDEFDKWWFNTSPYATNEVKEQVFKWWLSKLSSLRKEDYKELEAEISAMKKPNTDWTKDEHYKDCKDGCTYCCNADGMLTGHNSALDSVLDIIRSKKQTHE